MKGNLKLLNKKRIISSLQGNVRNVVETKIRTLQPVLQEIAKQSVQDLEAVDTGLLKSRTNAKIISTTKSINITFNTNNVEYAQYVYFGLGSNKSYGPRKFNLISALKAKQLFEAGNLQRVFGKGGSKQSGNLEKGKQKNILQRRKRLDK